MFYWKLTYLTCFGVMSVYDEIECYKSWTKRGVYSQFKERYGQNLPDDYTDRSHFTSYRHFKRMVERIDKSEIPEKTLWTKPKIC